MFHSMWSQIFGCYVKLDQECWLEGLQVKTNLPAEMKEFIDALYKMFQMVMHEMF